MKHSFICTDRFSEPNFISHMVQMKPPSKSFTIFLNNPFISHMVQMKLNLLSNKTKDKITFISHMVQMKLEKSDVDYILTKALYPTWFRWNEHNWQPEPWGLTFISHMVQMKPGVEGSNTALRDFFISHMVQMKPEKTYFSNTYSKFFISHMVQMKHPEEDLRRTINIPLYPTWFRWNFVFYFSYETNIIFISHMVQMKRDFWQEILFLLQALYPTWFRWNLPWNFLRAIPILLYIPHGSDETFFYCVSLFNKVYFISHMVQMKLFWILCFHFFQLLFISHMVQMKQVQVPQVALALSPLYPTWFRWNIKSHRIIGNPK